MSWMLRVFCCLCVVCIYTSKYILNICSAGLSSYLLFCCIYFDAWWITCCPKREKTLSSSLHRVIAYIICYIYFDAWCITCCWGISARFAGGGARFHTAVVFFNTVVVAVCVISIHGLPRCRGYWIWVFCCPFVVLIYIMFGWLRRVTCSFVSTSMFRLSHAVQNENKLWKFT